MRATFAALLLLAPLAGALPLTAEDDAGSGGDAGSTFAFGWPIERGVRYQGNSTPFVDDDLYPFDAVAGETVRLVIEGVDVCADLMDPRGTRGPGVCDVGIGGAWLDVLIEETGLHGLTVTSQGAPGYVFGLDVLGQRVPPHDDAGTGLDMSDDAVLAMRVDRRVAYGGDVDILDLDHYTFLAEEGETISFSIDGLDACLEIVHDSFGVCAIAGPTAATWRAPRSGEFGLTIAGLARQEYTFMVDAPAPDARSALVAIPPRAPHPPRGADPTCGTGEPVLATSGSDDGGLVFAALKTGFRAVVAWSTQDAVPASLTYAVDGGETRVLLETTPRTQHVFVLDGLPTGATLCFTPEGREPQALHLANAWNARRPDGAYVTNLLVVANTQVNQRAAVQQGIEEFAQTLRDMTDGHLAAGRVVLLFGDAEREQAVFACYLGVDAPGCDHMADVYFTYGSCPNGAACANPLGIDDPVSHVWMSSVWQANAAMDLDEEGQVLAHEMGHYLFGADDLYTTLGSGPDCYDAALSLSVMGAVREATELDDRLHRCPNEETLGADYVPTWERLRSHFPAVPDRLAIDEGPHGVGDAYALSTFTTTPALADVPLLDLPQDDAGSGHDAPGEPDPTFLVPVGVQLEGMNAPPIVDLDHFGFAVSAGDRVDVALSGVTCPVVLGPSGNTIEEECESTGAVTHLRFFAGESGVHYLQTALEGRYVFEIGVNAPAGLGPLIPEAPEDDAGSGRDAPDEPDPAFRIAPGVAYDGTNVPALLDDDHFAFEARAGQAFDLAILGVTCAQIEDEDGRSVSDCASSETVAHMRGTIPADGIWYVHVYAHAAYRFVLALDGPAELAWP